MAYSLTRKKIILRNYNMFSAIAINMKLVIISTWKKNVRMVLQHASNYLNILYVINDIE